MGDAEAMAIRPVSSLGWGRRCQTRGKAADYNDLLTECEKDPGVSIGVGVAKHRFRIKVMLIEPRRFLGLGRVDVEVIE